MRILGCVLTPTVCLCPWAEFTQPRPCLLWLVSCIDGFSFQLTVSLKMFLILQLRNACCPSCTTRSDSVWRKLGLGRGIINLSDDGDLWCRSIIDGPKTKGTRHTPEDKGYWVGWWLCRCSRMIISILGFPRPAQTFLLGNCWFREREGERERATEWECRPILFFHQKCWCWSCYLVATLTLSLCGNCNLGFIN